MDVHDNARLTPRGREALVRRVLEAGKSVGAAAADFGVSIRTARKWLDRFAAEGKAGLRDRSSRPRRSPGATPAAVVAKVVALRHRRLSGAVIGRRVGLSKATVARSLRRHGLGRLRALEPSEPARRYERQAPGELVHLDIKKLGRIVRPGHRVTGDRRDTGFS
jgi:transposase